VNILAKFQQNKNEHKKLLAEMNLIHVNHSVILYTDKNENQVILICKEILKESVAKSYMTNGLLIYG
jgi:hypothetical protein